MRQPVLSRAAPLRLGGRHLLIVAALTGVGPAAAGERALDARLHHLRQGDQPEWSDFPRQADGPRLVVRFQAERNASEWTLRLRQQDVKQTWDVLLGGKPLARLRPDENDMVLYLPVPAGQLADGENTLAVEQAGKAPEDIRVGEISLDDRPVDQVPSEAVVEVRVLDGQADRPAPLPCRVTVLNSGGR